jgi:type IV fimbrial biogenesis protein FimT
MNKSRGFTMVELMVVIAIIAIMATIAAPSFKAMLQSSSMTNAVNTFLADMRYARSESIRRGGAVVMCPSTDSDLSTASCSGGTGWQGGWIVFHDLNGNGSRTSSGTGVEPLLRVQGTIASVNAIAASSATTFQFTATGRLNLSAATSVQFGSNPPFATDAQRIVCIGLGGRTRIALDGAGKPTGNATCTTD